MIDNITAIVAAALLLIIPAVILWPELFPKKAEAPETYQLPNPKPVPKTKSNPQAVKPHKLDPNPETLKALHVQADAELRLAEALEKKASAESDPVKQARIKKQAALCWVRFNTVLDKIDRLTA